MTLRFDVDVGKFNLVISNGTQIKYTRDKFTIVVFANTRFDGCPILDIYVTSTSANGDVHRFDKKFDGLDYAMAWVDGQLQ